MQITHSIDISAPVQRVWDLTLDVEAWPDATPTVTTVRRRDDGPIGLGSTATVKQPGQRAKVWTVTEVEPCRSFAWTARVFGTAMTARHDLLAIDGGTTNTLTIDLSGRGAKVVGKLVGAQIHKALVQENQGFKRAAES